MTILYIKNEDRKMNVTTWYDSTQHRWLCEFLDQENVFLHIGAVTKEAPLGIGANEREAILDLELKFSYFKLKVAEAKIEELKRELSLAHHLEEDS